MSLIYAHKLQRSAEKATKLGRVDEALQLHKAASEVIEALLEAVLHEKARESLKLQRAFHGAQQKLLNKHRYVYYDPPCIKFCTPCMIR